MLFKPFHAAKVPSKSANSLKSRGYLDRDSAAFGEIADPHFLRILSTERSILGEFLTTQEVGLLSCRRERVDYVDAGADDILHVARDERKIVYLCCGGQ